MIALLVILGSSFVIALSGALMPGPLLTVTIGESTKQGFWVGPMLILGHGLLELFLLLALLAGLGPILQKDSVFGVIALVGALVLLWMAVGMFRSLPTLTLDFSDAKAGNNHLILSGALLSLVNPYWIIWWSTIGLGYIIHSQSLGSAGIIFFFLGHILGDLAWYSVISFSVSKGKSFFSNQFYRGLLGTCACFLIVFAGFFGYSGWERMF